MPSFSKMSIWPVGYFRRICSWLLRNRRDVSARVAVINAELRRIGFVTVFYAQEEQEDGTVRATERRTGFAVTRGSSLERLVQAYIAGGGNPLDISMFLHPDTDFITELSEEFDARTTSFYPHGGVAAPQSVEINDPVGDPSSSGFESYRGGQIPFDGNPQFRLGAWVDRGAWDDETIVRTMHLIRRWSNQGIREKVKDIEWRVIKLSDLYEQLRRERDEVLVEAFGDALNALTGYDNPEVFLNAQRIQGLMTEMWKLIYQPTGDGPLDSTQANVENVGLLGFTYEDRQSEELLTLS